MHFGGLTSDGFSSSGDGAAVVPVSRQTMGGGVDSTQMSRGGDAEWGKWCTLEASPGHLVVCHASLLPPAPLLLGPFPLCAGDSWQIGKALLLILWYLGTQERSYPCTARV